MPVVFAEISRVSQKNWENAFNMDRCKLCENPPRSSSFRGGWKTVSPEGTNVAPPVGNQMVPLTIYQIRSAVPANVCFWTQVCRLTSIVSFSVNFITFLTVKKVIINVGKFNTKDRLAKLEIKSTQSHCDSNRRLTQMTLRKNMPLIYHNVVRMSICRRFNWKYSLNRYQNFQRPNVFWRSFIFWQQISLLSGESKMSPVG